MGTHSASSPRRSRRLVRLLTMLRDNGHTSLSQLAADLGASQATIRRDVAELAAQGLIIRTHGGAMARDDRQELPLELRDSRNHLAKSAIGEAIAREIPAGKHSIGLTGGSTTAQVLAALAHRDDLTIITNSVSVGLAAVQQDQSRVLIAGGVLRPNSLEMVGSLTESTLKVVNVQTAIVGADGVSVVGGVTTHDDVEARTNHTLVQHAERVIVVADASKIGRITSAKLADLGEVDLVVTNHNASPKEVAALQDAGVTIRLVPPRKA